MQFCVLVVVGALSPRISTGVVMRHKLLSAVLGVCLAFGFVGVLHAQQTQGTISGTVSDPSGAVIPKAEVSITNQQTGAKRTVTSNETGFYTANALDPGTYTITVKVAGFKSTAKAGIVLHVADEVTVPVVLQIGVPSETVTVEAAATMVETRSGEVSNVIGSQQISELPLNGRSFVQLTLLVPGASASDTENPRFTGLLGGVDISMSGSPANSNAWLVDGVDNVDHGSGRTILVYPSVDSIEEFKIQRNSYGADMPSASGAQINLVTKSGTNRFHGSVYEFFRNDLLDANNYFLNANNKPKAELRSNNFGYTFGGPIKKDKLFFFWSEEWRKEVRGVTRLSSVPTDLERQGNFTPFLDPNGNPLGSSAANPQLVTSPWTGLPFPSNTIPSDCSDPSGCLSPAGLAMMQLFPHANIPTTVIQDPANPGKFKLTPVDNWVAAVPTHLATRQEQIRGDWNLSARDSVTVRFTNDYWENPAPNFGGDGGLWGDTGFPTVDSSWSQPSKSFAARLTSTFGGSKVNTFQFSYSNNRIYITAGLGADINADINSKVASVFPGVPGHAHAIFWGAPEQGLGSNLWNAAPWNNAHDIFTWKDDFSMTRGNHNHRIGAFFSYDKKDEDCCGASETTPQFWGPTAVPGGAGKGGGWGPAAAPGNGGQVTGNGLADLLLKGSFWGASEQSSQPRSKVRWKDIETYYADTFRVTRRFTLDYGVRWSILPPSIQADNRIGNFIPSLYDPSQGATALNGMIFPAGFVDPAEGIPGGSANLRGVHVGRALRNSSWDTIAPRFGFAFDPTGAGKWAIRGGAGIFFGRGDLSQPIGELLLNPPFNATVNFGNGRSLDALPSTLPSAGVGVAGNAADTNWKTQGSYQWNLTVERELLRDTKLEVAYVGNHGNHLPMNWDLNLIPPQDRLQWAELNFTPNSNTSLRDSLHQYAPLAGTNNLFYQTNGGTSSYHAFQANLTKRFSHGFSLGSAYSFSKLISIVSLDCCGNGGGARIIDPWNFNYNRGPGDFDRPHIFSTNVIYKLPELNGRNAFLREVIGGWEGTGVYSYSTGVPLTVTLNQNLVGVSTTRPDLVGNAKGPNTPTGGWLNPNAFQMPSQLGKLGTEGQGILHGPPTNNADLAIYKNFKFFEKTTLQFRFETFNTLNHTQFFSTSIDTNYKVTGLSVLQDPTSAYQPDPTKANYNPATDHFTGCSISPGSKFNPFPNCNTNGTFGLPQKARDPRELQLALKLMF
jgi:carboxypeptidase family protein